MHVGLIARGDVDYALDLANDLSEVGVTVTLYLCHAHVVQEVDTLVRPIERLYELELLPRTCKVRLIKLPRMRDPSSFGVFRRLSNTIQKDGVEIAHILLGPTELWFAVLSWLLRDIPVTSTMIVPKPNVGERIPFFIVWAIHKLSANYSNMIIVNGTGQVSLVRKLYQVPTNRIAYIPLSMRKTAMRWSSQQYIEEPGTVLFFGRAHPHKGLEYLFRAQPLITRSIPHARILISAHGKELEHCRKIIQDSSSFEIHEGFVSGKKMAKFFQRASLVALPYLSAASSGVLMTAYAFGKPVVATNISGLSGYIEEGVTGLLVPATNVEQLANAIIKLLSDDVLRYNMGENARRWVEKEQKKIAMQTIKVYEKAISIHRNT